MNNAQYPRIPSKVLEGMSNEEVIDTSSPRLRCLGLVDDEAKNPLILNVWSVETPRYPAWLQGV
jgi:hypothetical protein